MTDGGVSPERRALERARVKEERMWAKYQQAQRAMELPTETYHAGVRAGLKAWSAAFRELQLALNAFEHETVHSADVPKMP